ncbi:MAG: TIGR03619 family F420-dependent LLM class oxidoreductase [Actinomycetota bacterium]
MRYGATMFTTDRTVGPAAFARALEERGLYSYYVPEHTHIPISRTTPPPTGEAELVDEYRRTLDPFVALATAAAVTERLVVGTGVCLVAQRDPIVTAKAVASLEHCAPGRVVLGVGFGWNEDEAADHGVVMATRRDRAREHVLAMKALWADEVAAFRGTYIDLAPSWAWPKPAAGRPPIQIGGAAGPKRFAHVAEYADGRMPIGGRGVRAALGDLHRACDAVGRDPETVRVVPFGTIPDPGKLDYFESIGIEEVVLRVPGGALEQVLPLLDQYAALVG